MRKIKNLVFIFETFLTKFDFERFRFDYYESQGLKIRILNISPITRKKYYDGEKEKNYYIKNFQKICFSFKDLEKEILENDNLETASIIIISNFEVEQIVIKILKNHNIFNIKYIFGAQPFKKKTFFKIFLHTLVDFSGALQKMIEKIGIFKYKYLKKTEPDITFYVGSNLKPSSKSKSISLPSFECDKIIFPSIKKNDLKIKSPFALYLDAPYRHSDTYEINRRFPKEKPYGFDEYYGPLNKFFKEFEKITRLKICISSHPRANYTINPYHSFKLFGNKTFELATDSNCKVVLLHSSLAINYPILLNKPIIFLIHSKLSHSNKKNVTDLSNFFEKKPIEIDKNNFDQSIFKNGLRINVNQYNNYKRQFILEKDFKNTSYEIIYNTLTNTNDN